MQTTSETANCYSKSRFGCISLALSLAEIVIMWGDVVLFRSADNQTMRMLLHVNSITWFMGGLCSFGFAIAGLVADAHRSTAFVALMMSIVAFLVCGLQMLV